MDYGGSTQNTAVTPSTVYLSMGSNLGDRRAAIERGIHGLRNAGIGDLVVSSYYETEPVGYDEQPWFLNIAAIGRTTLPPGALLTVCKRIEADLGRTVTVRNGPRPLDIDILLYGSLCVDEENLVIPHPRMSERGFVLIPLLEIAPDVVDPCTGRRYSEALSRLDEGKKVLKSKPRES